MPLEELKETIRLLSLTPETVAGLVANFTEKSLREKQSPSEFSAIEHVCHLRDIEHEGYRTRINRLLNENEPLLPDINGDQLAVERQYNRQNLANALRDFAVAREASLHMIRDLTFSDLSRVGTLESIGTISLGQLLSMMRQHDHEHIGSLIALRKLLRRDRRNN